MPTIVLTHCVVVQIYGPADPADIVLSLGVGGSAGDGVVEVTAPQLPVPVNVTTGTTPPVSIPISKCTDAYVHYYKTPLGPNQISVTY